MSGEKRGHTPYLYRGIGYVICVRCGRVLLRNAASQRWWNEGCKWD